MRYRLTGSLEGGALSELFAVVGDDHFPLAMKLFFPHTTDAGYAKEIVRISQTVNELQIPELVKVFEVGFVRDRLAVVREQLDGTTLSQLLVRLARREVFISPSLCFSFLIDYLDVLQRAHDGGVIHGSLTPGNLIVTSGGSVSACDFGVVQALKLSPKLSRLFNGGGRSVYRAPEVIAGEPPSRASDLYSLAAVAYELLTLREARPEGSDPKRGVVMPPSRIDRRLSPRIDSLLMRALDSSPGRRYECCADFAEALREFVAVNGGGVASEERQRIARSGGPEEGMGPVPFSETFGLLEPVLLATPDDSLSDTVMRPVGLQLGGAAATSRHRDGMPYDDDTDPEPTAATEAAWDAPPGVVGGLRRRLLGQATASRPVKVKWVQDAKTPLPELDAPSDPETHVDAPDYQRSSPRRKSRSRGPASVIPVRFPRRVTDTAYEAANTGRSPYAEPGMHLDWRWPALILSALILLGIGFGFGRAGTGPQYPPAKARAAATAEGVSEVFEQDLGYDIPPGAGAGTLTLVSNLPARVYLDGALVRQLAPFEHYPVRSGTHRLIIEALATQERQEQMVTVQRGRTVSLQIAFGQISQTPPP